MVLKLENPVGSKAAIMPINAPSRPAGGQPAAERDFTIVETALPFPVEVLALGGELKNTVCLARGSTALLSGVHADLGRAEDFRRFVQTVASVKEISGNGTRAIAYDLHPMYAAARFAQRSSESRLLGTGPRIAVQHHHAHAVSCALDTGMALPVIGIVCDGTGYGEDGAIWGGEVLIAEADSFRRFAHLDYFTVPGGDAAARCTWRCGMGVLQAAFPDEWSWLSVPAFASIDPTERRIAARQLDEGLNAIRTSSLGRLFDAVASLTETCMENVSEGQAACTLEGSAGLRSIGAYPFMLCTTGPRGGRDPLKPGIAGGPPIRLDWRPMIREIVSDTVAGLDAGVISARFHATVVQMLAQAAELAAQQAGIDRVVLSGGCFMNKLLRNGLVAAMNARRLTVATHERVSTGDAGLSLGQAFIASHRAAREAARLKAAR